MEIWKYGDMAIWRYGYMEILIYGNTKIWIYLNMEIWKFRNLEIGKFGNMERWKYENMEIRSNNVSKITESSSQLEIFKLCIDFLKHGIWKSVDLKEKFAS